MSMATTNLNREMTKVMDATGAISTGPKQRPGAPCVQVPRFGIDVRQIRLNSKTTQQGFANMIGVPVKTLRNWEQGRRNPTGPALVLLTIIQRDPWIVFDIVTGQYQATPMA